MSKVLIALSVYNNDATISSAIESILCQTFTDWRLVVVDDGSTDASRKLIQKYIKLDRRIECLSNEVNLGLAVSLNKAISTGNEPFIARMDADDVAISNRIELQFNFMEMNPDIDVLGTAAKFQNSYNSYYKVVRKPLVHHEIYSSIEKMNPFIHSSIMMRRSFFEAMRGYDDFWTRAQDYDLWLRGVDKYTYANLSDVLMIYSERPQTFISLFYGFMVRVKNGFRRKRLLSSFFKATGVLWYGIYYRIRLSLKS